jgi:hypothetical protein
MSENRDENTGTRRNAGELEGRDATLDQSILM